MSIPPAWLSVLAWISLITSAACAAGIVLDIQRGHRQPMRVMEITWPVTALYLGPLGFLAYRAFGRALPGVGRKKKPFWQSVFVSATHCGGGCTLGDIFSDNLIAVSGLVIGASSLLTMYVCDFLAAYVLGLFFQYWPIRARGQMTPGEALVAAVKADTVSLIAFELGLFAWMAAVHFFAPHLHSDSAVFWFFMQIGMAIGFATTYPANWLLVRWGIKGGM